MCQGSAADLDGHPERARLDSARTNSTRLVSTWPRPEADDLLGPWSRSLQAEIDDLIGDQNGAITNYLRAD